MKVVLGLLFLLALDFEFCLVNVTLVTFFDREPDII